MWVFSYDNIAARKFMPMDHLIPTLKSGLTNRLHPYSLICDLPAHVCTCMCLGYVYVCVSMCLHVPRFTYSKKDSTF